MSGKAEKVLTDLGRKIDKFLNELDDVPGNIKEEFNQRVEELKKSKETLEGDLKSFKKKNKGKWEEVEDSFEKAGQELKNAFKVAFSRNPEKGPENPKEEGGDDKSGQS